MSSKEWRGGPTTYRVVYFKPTNWMAGAPGWYALLLRASDESKGAYEQADGWHARFGPYTTQGEAETALDEAVQHGNNGD